MKNIILIHFLLFLTHAGFSQVGKAATYYQQQNNLNSFSQNDYQTISNSLVLVGNCNQLLANVQANDIVNIDCIVDLNGSTINLPSNVTLVYDGGDIINGTLVFNQGTIDGELLNHTLEITGPAVLSNTTFVFNKNRWNIVEGVVTDPIANDNLDAINKVFTLIYSLNANTAQFDHLDAYFNAKGGFAGTPPAFYPWLDGIQLPGDNFTLEMTSNTILRVQPNPFDSYRLFVLYDRDNIVIRGGIFVGDRDKHDYSQSVSTNEWGHLLQITGSKNVLIENMILKNATGDGLNVNSRNFTYVPNYNQSRDIIIRNSIFDMNGRQGISVTDGKNILIENNQFLNIGVINSTFPHAARIGPWAGVDIEGGRTRNSAGDLVYYEYPEYVTIRNNVESGCRGSSFLIAIGYNCTIEDNVVESSIGYALGTGNTIRNNVITEPVDENLSTGIRAGKTTTESNFDNKIYGNIITGYDVGIRVGGQNAKIHNNTINDFRSVGMTFTLVKYSSIYLNKITSTILDAKGMYAKATSIDKTNIYANTINVNADGMTFSLLNDGVDDYNYEYAIYNNKVTVTKPNAYGFNGGAFSTAYSRNLKLIGNKFVGAYHKGQVRIVNFDNANIRNNTGDDATTLFLQFSGNNSHLENNRTTSGFILNNITGTNNVIIP